MDADLPPTSDRTPSPPAAVEQIGGEQATSADAGSADGWPLILVVLAGGAAVGWFLGALAGLAWFAASVTLALFASVRDDPFMFGTAVFTGLLALVIGAIWFASVRAQEVPADRAAQVDGCVGVVTSNLVAERQGVSGSATAGMHPGEAAAFRELDRTIPSTLPVDRAVPVVYGHRDDIRAACERHM